MNISRQRQLLDGQTSVARKVFHSVPIQDAWDEATIIREMRASGSSVTIAAHAVRSCLYDLKDAGLVKEPSKGHFQRATVTVREPKAPRAATSRNANSEPAPPSFYAEGTEPAPAHLVEYEATMKNTLTLAPAPMTPLDVLGTIATELTVFSVEFGARMKALSERVEDVALLIEAQREADAASMAKVRQLQDLLKDVVGHQ